MTRPVRILCLDIEGGFGGSSRSLYFLLKHVDRNRYLPEVWCRREGPIQELYAKLGIQVRIEPDMPKVSALPRLSRSIYAHLLHLRDFSQATRFRHRLVEETNRRFDVVHFNQEGLYLLARWLRKRVQAAFVMHNRTNFGNTWFAKRQARFLLKYNDVNVFITEREQEDVIRLAESGRQGVVIYNVVEIPNDEVAPHSKIPTDDRFTVACLANYSWLRGIDRLVDVAVVLRRKGHSNIRFVVGGSLELSGKLPGKLGEIAREGGNLKTYATARGVADMFVFLGHVPDPERVIAASHVLAKPSREDNPWGRDILEALAMGRPVFACGSFTKFVSPGNSGYLYPHDETFSPDLMAEDLARLAKSPDELNRLGRGAIARVAGECDGKSRAKDLQQAWENALIHRSSLA